MQLAATAVWLVPVLGKTHSAQPTSSCFFYPVSWMSHYNCHAQINTIKLYFCCLMTFAALLLYVCG